MGFRKVCLTSVLSFLSSTMLSYRAVPSSCWNWARARSALSLWRQITMLWGGRELLRGRRVQGLVWASGRCAEAALPGITCCPRPKQTAKAGRSTGQDWPETRTRCFLGLVPSWSRRVFPPATTPSTSRKCPATLPRRTPAASDSPWTWPRLLRLPAGRWGWTEIWPSVQTWWRGAVAAWSSRGTSSKPTRLIRSTAHHRLDVRSGSEY